MFFIISLGPIKLQLPGKENSMDLDQLKKQALNETRGNPDPVAQEVHEFIKDIDPNRIDSEVDDDLKTYS